MNKLPALLLIITTLSSCQKKIPVDTIYFNAKIYTVDVTNTVGEAMVIREGKVVEVGNKDVLLQKYSSENKIDLNGKTVFPGFIDAHCHFYGYGLNLSRADLTGTTSWESVLDRVKEFAASHPDGWILGRGWDQNDWEVKEFPTSEKLDSMFPDRPVVLKRIDGHASIVNKKALSLAGINANSTVKGGSIILKNGQPTGVLVDNAMDSVEKFVPKPSSDQIAEALINAQESCFAVGLTTVSDAGLLKKVIDVIDTLQKKEELKMRIYAMLSDDDENRNYYFKTGPYKTDRLNVRSFKFYADGALGSRGALLLKPYSDDPATSGLQLMPSEYFLKQAQLCNEHGFQMCTHAIGDSANRLMLRTYGEVLKEPNNKRWRIEHCQVIAPGDFEMFTYYSIIPSVQPTHATSDMYWATDRLGVYRLRGAYAYKELITAAGRIANGSDFPVEDINPLFGFYAAVTRKDQKGYPPDGFEMRNALSREEALRGMTIWAAYANFEEEEKGSLEAGKYADFVVLDKDIMKIPEEEIFSVKVLETYVNGEKVYGGDD